jgi:hypothetical protein
MLTVVRWIEIALFVGGLIATGVLTVRRWERLGYRLVPFAYATAYAIVLSLIDGKSTSDLVAFVLGANIAAGLLFFAMWIEMPRTRRR